MVECVTQQKDVLTEVIYSEAVKMVCILDETWQIELKIEHEIASRNKN